MAISDKVKVGMVEYGVPATILVEFAAIAVLAWRLGGWVWAVAAMAVIAVLFLSPSRSARPRRPPTRRGR